MSSKSFIAIADIHLGHKLYNLPELEQDIKDEFVRACSVAISKNVNYLVIVGDLYNDNQPRPDTIAFVKAQVARLKEHGIVVLGIAGDHDKPVNGETWCQVSDIEPINSVPEFFGYDYFDYSSEDDPLLNRIKQCDHKDQIKWIFLHGQVPTLFKFTEDKKKLDFSKVDIFDLFPNLKGVILGDIHYPNDGEISDKDRTVYAGYCGSLSIIDISEIVHDKRLMYFDGNNLIKLPFANERAFVKIDFTGAYANGFEAAPFVEAFKGAEKKPVFVVVFDSDSEGKLSLTNPLLKVGIVKTSRKKKNSVTGQEESINIRSELSTEDRITTVLEQCCKDNEILSLATELLDTDNPKLILDKFKEKML